MNSKNHRQHGRSGPQRCADGWVSSFFDHFHGLNVANPLAKKELAAHFFYSAI
jgi:hypothetical protein